MEPSISRVRQPCPASPAVHLSATYTRTSVHARQELGMSGHSYLPRQKGVCSYGLYKGSTAITWYL
jgi:hypothetical protein